MIYRKHIKRWLDFVISLFSLLFFSPLFFILILTGTVKLKGNPFFVQRRPGKNGIIFKLIKFRTMTNEKDKQGELLPDDKRLNAYGRFLRSTSLDEIPELLNIVKGEMAIVGPRPLAEIYLPYYTEEERHRHDVRPGLTGLAQVNGRNNLSWDDKLAYDVEYVKNISFFGDLRIIAKTVKKVLTHEGIGQGEERPISLHVEREKWTLTENGAVRPPEVTQDNNHFC